MGQCMTSNYGSVTPRPTAAQKRETAQKEAARIEEEFLASLGPDLKVTIKLRHVDGEEGVQYEEEFEALSSDSSLITVITII